MTLPVAVVVPMYKKVLSPSEQMSLRSLRHHLSRYPLILIAPEGYGLSLEGFSTITFPVRDFSGRHKYSELLVSRRFYRALERYTYILLYQLDCLVFSDHLRQWCERGYDYIGAPWAHRNKDGTIEFTGVGNGGFSLRRVESCLQVLAVRDQQRGWTDQFKIASHFSRRVVRYAARGVRAVMHGETNALFERSRRAVRTAFHEAVPEYENEDLFWARAPTLVPSFRIAPPEIAVSFSFEMEPRFCFELNAHDLPFGCHQWETYDPAFWEPYLEIATGPRPEPPSESSVLVS